MGLEGSSPTVLLFFTPSCSCGVGVKQGRESVSHLGVDFVRPGCPRSQELWTESSVLYQVSSLSLEHVPRTHACWDSPETGDTQPERKVFAETKNGGTEGAQDLTNMRKGAVILRPGLWNCCAAAGGCPHLKMPLVYPACGAFRRKPRGPLCQGPAAVERRFQLLSHPAAGGTCCLECKILASNSVFLEASECVVRL